MKMNTSNGMCNRVYMSFYCKHQLSENAGCHVSKKAAIMQIVHTPSCHYSENGLPKNT